MEAVPRLPMLNFELKVSPESTDYGSKLKPYIQEVYREDANTYSKEINELEGLRAAAVRVPLDFTGCTALKKYYCQLHFLQSRFPMGEEETAAVAFSWCDIYTGSVYSIADIKYEMACILYNVAALHTKLGAADSRQSADGMKMSCTHFQCAAWAFQHLKEVYPQPKGSDMSHDLLTFMYHVTLAQAQECILEKSMVDNRKANIIAKVAAQIVDYYKSSLKTLDQGSKSWDQANLSETLGGKLYKRWHRYVELKVAFQSCVSLLYQGQQVEEQQKMGERVAYYQAALDKLNEAMKIAKGMDKNEAITDALTFTLDVVGGKLNAATKENEYVYHEKVPEKDSLPEVKGASLVKGIPFSVSDTEISGQDIFSRLVPMEAHEASSLYSEEKAKLLRRIGASIEEKDQELMTYQASLKLDQLKIHSEPDALPSELVECAAALNAKPNAIPDLVEAMNKLSGVFHDVEAGLKEVRDLLQEEEKKEKEYQVIMGKRPPSNIITDLQREAGKYQEAHSKASESNQTLHKAMSLHIANLKLLSNSLEDIQKQLPTVAILDSPNNDASVKELQHIMAKVEEMKKQRAMLESQLREAIQTDDITKQLVTHKDKPQDEIFSQALKKHERHVSLLEQNLAAQDNILRALTEANARYADTRKSTNEITRKRESTMKSLVASYEAYEDLLGKCNLGMEFYKKLEANTSKLLQRVKSVCKVQDEEREQMLLKSHKGATKKVENENAADDGLKLKDYLQYMKVRPDMNSSLYAAYASAYAAKCPQVPASAAEPVQNQNKVENVRPTPVGSESADGSNAVAQPASSEFSKSAYAYQYQQPYAYSGGVPTTYPVTSGYAAGYQCSKAPTSSEYYNYPNVASTSSTLHNPVSTAVTTAPSAAYQYYAQGQDIATYPPQASVPATYNTPSVPYSVSSAPYSAPTVPYSTAPSDPYSVSSVPYSAIPVQYSSASTSYNAPSVQDASASTSYSGPSVQYSSASTPYGASSVLYNSSSTPFNASSVPYNGSSASYTATSAPYTATSTAYSTSTTPYSASAVPYKTESYHTPYTPSSTYSSYPNTAVTNLTYSQYSEVSSSQYQYPYASGGYTTPTSGTYTTPSSYGTQASNVASVGTDTAAAGGSYAGYYGTGASVPYSSAPAYSSYGMYDYQQGYQLPGTSSYYQAPETYQQGYQYPAITTAPALASASYNNGAPGFGAMPTSHSTHKPEAIYSQSRSNACSTYSKAQPSISHSSVVPASNLDLLSDLDLASASSKPLVPEPVPQGSQSASVASSTKLVATKELSRSSDILSEDGDSSNSGRGTPILQPKILNTEDIKKQKEEQVKQVLKTPFKDPYIDPDTLNRFVQEVEKFEKFVESLNKKSLNGPTPLDMKWKELQDLQEKDAHKRSISVARCYPMKNRFPDILPFDHSRVELPSTKDDYINASHIKDLSSLCPHYIAAQAPLPSTYSDFWFMVWEQQAEIIVCLLSDAELKNQVYWPTEKGQELSFGALHLNLQSTSGKQGWVERILSLTNQETKTSKVVIHLQFVAWPGSSFPASPAQVLHFTSEVQAYYRQQRCLLRPVLVHCLAGVGRTGLFCLVSAAVNEILAGHGIIDLVQVAAQMSQQRKNIMKDREHLKFGYQALLYYSQDLLMKRGILSTRPTFEDKPKSGHTRHPSEDFILSTGTDLNKLQSKIGLEATQSESEILAPSESKTEVENGVAETSKPALDEPTTLSRSSSNLSVASSSGGGGGGSLPGVLTMGGSSSSRGSPVRLSSSEAGRKLSLPPSLSHLDALNFSLDSVPVNPSFPSSSSSSSHRNKISKEDFQTAKGSLRENRPDDPLSQLDPLWSLNK